MLCLQLPSNLLPRAQGEVPVIQYILHCFRNRISHRQWFKLLMRMMKERVLWLAAGGVAVGVSAVVLYLGRVKVARWARATHSRRVHKAATPTRRSVHIVTNAKQCSNILAVLSREARTDGGVGLDCEWVQAGGRRRAVALLQLASSTGTCAIIRLSHMKTEIPQALQTFLKDESILKVGVGTVEDSNYLAADYGLEVRGCVDLRHLALACLRQDLVVEGRNGAGEGGGGGEGSGLGLSGLAERYLGIKLDKDWRVRASDWEAETLTPRQVKYAANDALVGIQLLVALTAQLGQSEGYKEKRRWWEVVSTTTLTQLLALLFPSPLWRIYLASWMCRYAQPFVDRKFSSKPQSHQGGGVTVASSTAVKKSSQLRESPMRRGPLYHNCQLLAPDDVPLCTLDPKKAYWYVEKDLGVLVSEDPLVVRLKFEPAGRPQAESEDGAFYLQSRLNVCVVCGHEDSYIRKSIVPHEYRRHFPRLLKHHQNHDVVLLCFPCHRTSNMVDNALRVSLGEEFGALVSTDPRAKASIDGPSKAARDAARALLKPPGTIPAQRHATFLTTMQKCYPNQELTQELLEQTANIEVKVYPAGHVPHGLGVFQAYSKVGLTQLEQRWRQHFLDTMKPKFMPECWSVSHNTYKLRLKMARLPLDDPDRDVYKMALVGTEGTIHVPYDPNVGRKPRLDGGPHYSSDSDPSKESTPEDISTSLSSSTGDSNMFHSDTHIDPSTCSSGIIDYTDEAHSNSSPSESYMDTTSISSGVYSNEAQDSKSASSLPDLDSKVGERTESGTDMLAESVSKEATQDIESSLSHYKVSIVGGRAMDKFAEDGAFVRHNDSTANMGGGLIDTHAKEGNVSICLNDRSMGGDCMIMDKHTKGDTNMYPDNSHVNVEEKESDKEAKLSEHIDSDVVVEEDNSEYHDSD